jgi:hypothetical protein
MLHTEINPHFQGSSSLGSQAPVQPGKDRTPGVYVFNPFAEGYIAQGKAFTPVKSQAMLAEDLANLPQFLFEVSPTLNLPGPLRGNEPQRPH